MRIYRLTHPEITAPRIQAARTWCLPGVRCEFCDNTWTSVGLDYPSLDLSSFPLAPQCRARVIPLADFRVLRRALLDWLERPLVVRPGTGFGPLTGRARGSIRGLAWFQGLTPLFSVEVFRILERQARRVRGQRTLLKGRGQDSIELFELDPSPGAELHPSVIPVDLALPCPQCGWWALKMPERIVLKASSIPNDTDVFRGIDLTTAIFVTERFAHALRDSGTTNFVLKEVEVR
jgi:uncharacterized double-CXXCG motif protein